MFQQIRFGFSVFVHRAAAASTSRAALLPEPVAPWTVPLWPSLLVASPAKKSVLSTGSAKPEVLPFLRSQCSYKRHPSTDLPANHGPCRVPDESAVPPAPSQGFRPENSSHFR